jgi:hypothetical protein
MAVDKNHCHCYNEFIGSGHAAGIDCDVVLKESYDQ